MRIIQDGAFQRWEAYATTGDFGYSRPARIVFRCLTDPGARARIVDAAGDKSDAESRVRELTEDELRSLLVEAEILD